MNDTELETISLFSEGYEHEKIAKILQKNSDYIRHILRHARLKYNLQDNNQLKILYKKLFPQYCAIKKYKKK